MTAPTPDHIRAAIVADYLDGMSQITTAEKHGVGPATVNRIIRAAGVSRGRRTTCPDALDAAVADYLESGDSIRVVAARHPVGSDTLAAELRKRDASRRSGSRTASATRAEGIAEFLAGDTIATIALRHGVGRSTVSKWLAEEGLRMEDREGESPINYRGGWVRQGLVMRPAKPIRQRVSA